MLHYELPLILIGHSEKRKEPYQNKKLVSAKSFSGSRSVVSVWENYIYMRENTGCRERIRLGEANIVQELFISHEKVVYEHLYVLRW